VTLDRLGRFSLLERIAHGSMGEVYKARDEANDLLVAIKVMAPEFSEEEELVERFRREVLAMTVLAHPNIARVFEHGRDQGRLFMVMELLTGQDLVALIGQGAMTLDRKIDVMTQCCAGMAFVHAYGVVHRDLKPANIHLTHEGVVKIMDFGVARIADSVMTQLGTIMGSPSYMSPEVVMGRRADARSDVFSLGAVFYELLSGKRAFPGKALHQVMMSVMSSEPVSLREAAPDIPPPITAIVEKCLRKDPAQRYADAGAIHIDLVAAVSGG
jgi:serine/threonine protein kinase